MSNTGRNRPSGRDALIERIAREHLDVETLETRSSDRLDFHDCAVWCLKRALEAAYLAGVHAGRGESRAD